MKRNLTTAQAIMILVAANLIAIGYLTSLTNYNHDVGVATQHQIIQLVNDQGNISSKQRQILLNEFTSIAAHGGLATHNEQQSMLQNITLLLNQAESLNNHTALVANQTHMLLASQDKVHATLANNISMDNQKLLKDILENQTHNNNK